MFLADRLIAVLAYGIPILLIFLSFYFYKKRKKR